jgi:hypothetical protein
MAAATTKTYRRASDVATGIGENLSTILGTDVLLHKYNINERSLGADGDKTIVLLTLSSIDDPEDTTLYHAWSESLATKIAEISDEDLREPMLIKFVKVPTRRPGFTVLSFE